MSGRNRKTKPSRSGKGILSSLAFFLVGVAVLVYAILALVEGEVTVGVGENDSAAYTRQGEPIRFWFNVSWISLLGLGISAVGVLGLTYDFSRLVRRGSGGPDQDEPSRADQLKALQEWKRMVSELPQEERTPQEHADKLLVAGLRSEEEVPSHEVMTGKKAFLRSSLLFPAIGPYRQPVRLRVGGFGGGGFSIGDNHFKVCSDNPFITDFTSDKWILEHHGEVCARGRKKPYSMLDRLRDDVSGTDEQLLARMDDEEEERSISFASAEYVTVQTSKMHLSLVPSPFQSLDEDPTGYIVANGTLVGSIRLQWVQRSQGRHVLKCAWIDCSPSVPDHLQLFLLWLAANETSVGNIILPFQKLFALLTRGQTGKQEPGKFIDQATFRCACERCGGHLEVSVEDSGSFVECPHCRESTQLLRSDASQDGFGPESGGSYGRVQPEWVDGSVSSPTDNAAGAAGPQKSWLTTYLLAFFLGSLGVDRFYNGRIGLGIGKLLTGGACGLWSLIDVMLLLFNKYQDAQGHTLRPAKRGHMVAALSILGAMVLFNIIFVGAAVHNLKSGLTDMESEFVAGFADPDLRAAADPPREGWNEASTSAEDDSAVPGAVINHVLNLDGRDSCVELPPNTFAGLTEATVECWVKWDRLQNYSRAFDLVIEDRLVTAMNQGTNPDLCVETFVAGNRRYVQGPGLLRLGQWTHLAVTVGPDHLAVYVNGRPLSQRFEEEPDTFRSADYGRQNLLGRSNARKVWADDKDFDGQLDEIRVWSRVRTPEEVKAGINARLTGDEPNLIGRLSFDDSGDPGRQLDLGSNPAKLVGGATLVATAESEILSDFLLNCAETNYRNDNMKEARRLAEQAAAEASTPPALAKAQALLELIEPPAPVDLSRFTGREIYLSDAVWSEAKVGWGKPVRNAFFVRNPLNTDSPLFLELANAIYPKGLYAHAPSRYAFKLNEEWTRFEAIVGLQTGAFPEITGVFVVKGDGTELYRSQPLLASSAQPISIDVQGVDLLELIVEPGQPSTKRCWTIWCDPRIGR